MNGTTGLASCRTIGPAQTIRTSAATVSEPMEPEGGARARKVGDRPDVAGDRRHEHAAGHHGEIQAEQDRSLEQPEPAEQAEQQRVLEHRGDHRGEERLGEGVERLAPRGTSEDEARAELERRRGEDEQAGGEGDGKLGEDAVERRRRRRSRASRRCCSQIRPMRNAEIPATPTRSSAMASRSRSCRPSTAGMVRGARQRGRHQRGIGAGGGIRTRDNRLGRPGALPLSYARSGCRFVQSFERSKPVAVRADDIALAASASIRSMLTDHPRDGTNFVATGPVKCQARRRRRLGAARLSEINPETAGHRERPARIWASGRALAASKACLRTPRDHERPYRQPGELPVRPAGDTGPPCRPSSAA